MFHEALACIYTYTYYRKYMCRNQISFCSYVSQDRIFKFSYLNNYCKSVTDLWVLLWYCPPCRDNAKNTHMCMYIYIFKMIIQPVDE